MHVLVRTGSKRFRFMKKRLDVNNIPYQILDFGDPDWIEFDFRNAETLFCFPIFAKNTATADSVYQSQSNIKYIADHFPHLRIFPDPNLIDFYNDKYNQYLFLHSYRFPIPPTIPITSIDQVDTVIQEIGLPLVLKNRHGSSGNSVFLIKSAERLKKFVQVALGHFSWNVPRYIYGSHQWLRNGARALIRPKSFDRTTLSLPLLAQKRIHTDRDLRIVVVNGKLWEGHWRLVTRQRKWQVSGAHGIWAAIPKDIKEVCELLAAKTDAKWIAIDVLLGDDGFFITEFSPVWHHYFLHESESFSYGDDYNVDVSLEEGHDLEGMLLKTLFLEEETLPFAGWLKSNYE